MVVSPHLDDGVLGAGQFMAGRPDVVLVTVTAGDAPEGLSDYDRSCGFSSSADAVASRRAEDNTAAGLLRARTVHLAHADGQYGTPLNPAAVADDIRGVLVSTGATMVLGPLGLAHPDHEATAAAMLDVAADENLDVWLYEELPARVMWPETVVPALGRVRAAGFEPVLDFPGTGALSSKYLAVRAYRSQLASLSAVTEGCGLNPILCPERYWVLQRQEKP